MEIQYIHNIIFEATPKEQLQSQRVQKCNIRYLIIERVNNVNKKLKNYTL